MKILDNKSVRGLSVVASELEVVGYTISLGYCLHKELPFSAFGELAFLLIQALILVDCIYYFSQPLSLITWVKAIFYFTIAPTVFAGKIDPLLFKALYASNCGYLHKIVADCGYLHKIVADCGYSTAALQIADIFTKSLPRNAFILLRNKLGVGFSPVSSLRGGISNQSNLPETKTLNLSEKKTLSSVNSQLQILGPDSTQQQKPKVITMKPKPIEPTHSNPCKFLTFTPKGCELQVAVRKEKKTNTDLILSNKFDSLQSEDDDKNDRCRVSIV